MTIINSTVNAVAMTVLPDAPFDVATGIQISTIAVATEGGVSVIKHDGTVVNSASNGGIACVAITSGFELLYGHFKNVQHGFCVANLKDIQSNFNSFIYTHPQLPFSGRVYALGALISTPTDFGERGLSLIKKNSSNPEKSLIAYINQYRNTGYMMGDIRRAYLCNTEVESVTATELVINGTFDTDTAGWAPSGTSLAVVGGELELTATTAFAQADITINTVIGGQYTLTGSGYRKQLSGNIGLTVGAIIDGAQSTPSSLAMLSPIVFTAISTTTAIRVRAIGVAVGDKFAFDNISVKKIIPDRSYKAAGATIMGTLVKSLVA